MDDQPEIERLANVCIDLKKTIDDDLEKRKQQDKSDKWWQVTTLFLPILMTAGVGLLLSNGQARLQESIASSEEFNDHQLARYENLDSLAIGLQESIEALSSVSQDGSKESGDALNAAVDALGKFKDPLSGLYFDDDLTGPVQNIIDA